MFIGPVHCTDLIFNEITKVQIHYLAVGQSTRGAVVYGGVITLGEAFGIMYRYPLLISMVAIHSLQFCSEITH